MKYTRATNHYIAAEILETRIAPATLTAPGMFSYTDADGDIVKVKVDGLFASIDFLDSAGADVSITGGDIAKIAVTKAGKNFAITFADTNAGGGNVIELGNISAVDGGRLPNIAGIYTVPSADGLLRYELNGFRGTGFTKGGGLKIFGPLTGADVNSAGLDLLTVPIETSVLFANGISLGATAIVKSAVAGEINVSGDMDGTITVGSVSGQFLLDQVNGQMVVQNALSGRIFTSDVAGLIEVQGSATSTSRITTSGDLNLNVLKDLGGSTQVVGDLALEVGGSIKDAAVIVGKNLTLGVGGSILKSRILTQEQFLSSTGVRNDIVASSLIGGTGLQFAVGRSITGSALSSGMDDMILTVAKDVTKTLLSAGDDMSVTIGGNAKGSRVLPDGQLDAVVTGSVASTQIGSQSSSATITVGGKMLGSTLIAGEDAAVDVVGDITKLNGTVGANANISTAKNLASSTLSVGSDLQVTVGGNLMGSTLFPANTLTVDVAKNLDGGALSSFDNSSFINVGGAIRKASLASGESVTVSAGTMESSARVRAAANVTITAVDGMASNIIAGGDVSVTTTGVFAGTVSAGQNLTIFADSVNVRGPAAKALPSAILLGGFLVGGDFQLDVVKNYSAPAAVVGGDMTRLHIGGNFKGNFRVAGDLVTGDTTSSTMVIGGSIGATSLIEISGDIGSATSSPQLVFGGAFLGRLLVGGALKTDLSFNAGVSRLDFDGGIGPALLGDNIVNIIVNGKLASLSSANLFQRTDAAGGRFFDGAGNLTGILDTTIAAVLVTPEDFTP